MQGASGPRFVDFARLRAQLAGAPVTRFAPSPTGYLHLGHVAHALYVWGITAGLGGKLILRLENHDLQRSRPAYEEAILADLSWLGFLPAPAGMVTTPWERQSEQMQHYHEALSKLKAADLVYACRCSRKEQAAAVQAMGRELAPAGEAFYPGTCRGLALGAMGSADELSWRFKVAAGQVQGFHDYWLGAQSQEPAAQVGDFVLRDRVGQFTYQCAVVVDDLRQGVNLVVRGLDLLTSCGRQEALRQALGATQPLAYLHHGLLLEERAEHSGVKLSKSLRSASVASLRAAGWRPEAVLGEAAYRAGLLASPRPLQVAEAADLLAGPHA